MGAKIGAPPCQQVFANDNQSTKQIEGRQTCVDRLCWLFLPVLQYSMGAGNSRARSRSSSLDVRGGIELVVQVIVFSIGASAENGCTADCGDCSEQ